MKKSIRAAFMILFLAIVVGCSTSGNELPPISSIRPNTAKEGTLANQVLTQDASLAIREIAGGNSRVLKFVIQEPVGQPGNKAWREVWIYDPEGAQESFIMTFREDGQGSADFEIQRM